MIKKKIKVMSKIKIKNQKSVSRFVLFSFVSVVRYR